MWLSFALCVFSVVRSTCCSVSLQWKACRPLPHPFHSLLTPPLSSLMVLTSCVCSSTSKGFHQPVLSILYSALSSTLSWIISYLLHSAVLDNNYVFIFTFSLCSTGPGLSKNLHMKETAVRFPWRLTQGHQCKATVYRELDYVLCILES